VAVVRLIRIDEELSRTVAEQGDAFDRRYGASLGESGSLVEEVVTQTLALLRRAPRAPEWGGFLAVDPEQGAVIGTCGFRHGPEADGTVEIAYYTFPPFERRGHATAMARELVRRALASPDVRRVIAHTLPERNVSTRVLERAGLELAGEAHDPEDGRVWRWIHPSRAEE
jgi:RimJ/RimL family protein N-acetyltransferase